MANASNPNVRLLKTIEGGATTITNGDSLKYILTVDNAQGVTEALNVVTVDTLPQGLTYNSTEISYDGGATWATLTGVTSSVSGGVTTITTPSVRRIDPDGKVWGGTSAIATQLGTQNVRYRITATANGAVFGNVTNSATATSGVTETTTVADNTGTRDVTINRRTELGITKTNNVTAVNAGGTTAYTVRVINNGPDTVTGAVLRDAAATGLTKTAVACSATPGQCSTAPTSAQLESAGGFALPALASGQVYEITVTATVNATSGSVTNTATVAVPSGATDPDTTNNSASDTDTVTPVANLAITKTDGVTAVNAGGTTTYTIRVTNSGPSAVTGAVLRDAAATGLTKGTVACSTTPGQCTAGTTPTAAQLESAGGFALPTLASGQFYELTLTATVNATSGSVTNTATIAAPTGTTDPDTTNNSASDADTVTPVANLAITKTNDVSAVSAGSTTTYTIRVTNSGPSAVTGAVLRDAAATGLTKGAVACSGTPGQCTAGTTPTAAQLESAGGFALPTLASGQFYELTLTATVNATSGSVTNTATIAAPTGTTDPDTTNNSASDTDTVTPVANLAITKTNDVSAVNAGSTTTYTIRVTNGGPSSVTGAILKDAAATGLTKGTVACSSATGNTCAAAPTAAQLESGSGFALPALASGAFYEITLSASVTATGGTVANTATVDAPSGTVDPTPGNNTATDTDTVTPVADLSITKTDGVTAVNAGGTTTYTIRVTNSGPSAVTGAVLRDAAATGLTKGAVACSGTPGQCTAGTTPTAAQLESAGGFALPTLASGQFYEITLVATVTATSGTVTNTATIAAPNGTTDPTPGNNSASDANTVTPVADLSITNNDGVATLTTGGTTTYTIRVTNAGPSSVTGATLTDAAPTGLTFTAVACSAATSNVCAAGTTPTVTQLQNGYALPALASGAFYEIQVTATVTATSGSVANTATVAVPSGTTDPTPGNNTATDTDTIGTAAFDLSIAKSGPAFAKAAEAFAYTVTLTNATSTAATNVTVTDVLPAGLTFVSASDSGTYNAGTRTVTWTLASVAANSTTTLTLNVTAPAGTAISPAGGVKSAQNTASLSAAGDSNAANNTSGTVTTRFVLNEITKRVRNVTTNTAFGTSGGGKPGEVLEYCLDTANLGGADLPGYALTDQVPSNVNALTTGYDADEPTAATGFGVRVARTTAGVTTTTYRTSAADADSGALTTTGGTFGQGTMTLGLGTLLAGESATACFQATIR